MLHLITGAAGLVGVNLSRRLIARGDQVLAVDNLSRGRRGYLAPLEVSQKLHFAQADCANLSDFRTAIASHVSLGRIGEVWHMAANSDIPAGNADPHVDHRDTFLTTFNTLILMREFAIPTLRFASSSAIYGDHGDLKIKEDTAPYRPVSNYGAMKLASEAQISVAAETHLTRADIFRFPNVVGTPATHGVILDLVRKMRKTPENLEVLGNGTQQKVYLHIDDLIDAMLFITNRAQDRFNVHNIGPADNGVSVKYIAECVRAAIFPTARISYGSEARGWVGDIPKYSYSTERLTRLGWTPRHDSAHSVQRAVAEIASEELGG
jgi:UDP-glucose 4-epimerase